jgi:AcrR family transcriptional regulator
MEPAPTRPRATLVNSRSRETRQALIRAALDLWGEGDFDQAYEASTVADIARAAGVSKGTFYFHFANKAEVLRALSSTTVRTMLDQIDKGAGQGVPLRQLSDQVMAALARRITRGPRAAALLIGTLGFRSRAGEVSLEGPRLGMAFEALLRYGVARTPAPVDVEEGTALLTAVTMAAVISWGTGDRSAAWLHCALPRRAAVVLRGLGLADDP